MSRPKIAYHGAYTVSSDESGKVAILINGAPTQDSIKSTLRKISEEIGFDYDPAWITQMFGRKVIDFINSKHEKPEGPVITPSPQPTSEVHPMVKTVVNDVCKWLHELKELLFNERDMQMHLAAFLREKVGLDYDDVDLEYYVPNEAFNIKDENGKKIGSLYPWKSNIYVDLVIRKGNRFVAIELKYLTKEIKKQISRFGEKLDKEYPIVRSQGAQDLGLYNVWRDVKRIEVLKHRFENCVGGIALLLTNDKYYRSGNIHQDSNNYPFRLLENTTGLSREKRWNNPEKTISKDEENRPPIILEKVYSHNWNDIVIKTGSNEYPFDYLLFEL